MPKILLINWRCPRNPLAGGAEIYAYEIFKRIKDRGYEITYLAERFPDSKEEEEIEGIRILRIGNKWTFNFSVYRNINEIVENNNFDLVIDDLNKIPFYSPYFLKNRIPVLALVMHLFRNVIFSETNIFFGSYVYLTESLIPLIYKNNYFACLSQSTKEDLLKLFKNKKEIEEKIYIISPGIDFNKYKPDFSKKKERIICHVGRLKKYKSVHHLIYAVKILKEKIDNFKVLIVGEGDDKERLMKLVKKLNLSKIIEFTGYVSEEEKINIYQTSLFLVENSIKEGWGLIVLEANACGIPVISANTPGLKETVIDGETGFFYSYGDINMLAEKMKILLENDSLREEMGKKALAWAKNFTWEKSADLMKELIEKVLNYESSN
ncbi:MAG: glycosyltransferase family 4 protein [candidate division WOR-3 bacterium]|nr:glycosyltransferase family 4 protein [candidate division WOR-3 bacterium]MCX7837534.1 glycosyltransferase family 4 protein [candidate division WOR-3 bacterium]MDW8113968.1 glycosyltransferase family 4 protein [candidate division WOR-3 bacterium]